MATKREIDMLGLDYALKFTAAYQQGSKQNKYIRETLCDDLQFPAVLVSPRTSDILCGKRMYPEVGYSPQYGGMGYYFDATSWEGENAVANYTSDELLEWNSLKKFWETEATAVKCFNSFSDEMKNRLWDKYDGGNVLRHPAYPLYRMAGLQMDYKKLIDNGIIGLELEINQLIEKAKDDEAKMFYTSAIKSVKRIRTCISHYILDAKKLPDTEKKRKMIAALSGLLDHAPKTFHEGIQLILLVQTITGTINFGRMDIVLGNLLVNDLDNTVMTWEEGIEIMQNFYTVLEEEIWHFDARIIVGGLGRTNVAAADKFAMLAMETTDSLSLPMPQLSLRFYEGQNSELLEKAYDVIGNGKTFPILYNDDVNVSAVEKAFHVDRQTAEQYLPFGCGEYMIEKQSCGTPNVIINLQRCLELAMNNGRCLRFNDQRSPDYGNIETYTNFEQLWSAYENTVNYFLEAGAKGQESIYKITGQECPFSLISVFYDDCLAAGRSIFDGGIKYLGGTCETYGNNNTADSLTAIDELIFKASKYSGAELLTALKANWEDFDSIHKSFKDAPKFGNDNDIADAMQARVHEQVCLGTSNVAKNTSLHHWLVVIINNNHNTLWGKETSASADGRKNGEPLAPGNSAAAGADKSGLSALLNSQAKPDPTIHAGAVHNVKLSANFPKKNRNLYHSLFRSYFKKGGTQTMVTVTSRADLEAALETPEKYSNLLVRVGGFSARFIDLDKPTQMEILSRTEH
jgi:pyruvate-formate lyase